MDEDRVRVQISNFEQDSDVAIQQEARPGSSGGGREVRGLGTVGRIALEFEPGDWAMVMSLLALITGFVRR